jgi:cyclomaltodextrinase / maltogenic alpha-amylase / neopullulanase
MKRTILIFLLIISELIIYGQVEQQSYVARHVAPWFSNGIIYQVWLRSFTREGTLKTATSRLKDIADLGVTILYLPPVFLADTGMSKKFWSPRQQASHSNNPRNPYRSADYSKIDPEYGNEGDLRLFILKAHSLGLHVIMDMVYLHTGPNNILTKNPEYYYRDTSGNFFVNSWNFYRLNFNNRELREYLITDMEHWVKSCNIDGFRCDVSGSIPVDFWEEARLRLEKLKPDIGMLAESNEPREQLKAFDANYAFPWLDALKKVVVNGESAAILRETWEKMNSSFPKGALFARYSDNHDQNRTVVVFGDHGSMAVTVLNFTIDGIPFIYNGQEVGDAAPFSIFDHYPILWDATDATDAVGTPHKKSDILRNWYKKLIKLRLDEHSLTDGETIWLDTDNPESVVAFLRHGRNSDIISVINLSNRHICVNVKLPSSVISTYSSVFGEDKNQTLSKETPLLSLGGFGYYVGKEKK